MIQFEDLAYGWAIRPDSIATQLEHLSELATTWRDRFKDPEFVSLLESLSESERDHVIAQFINELKMVTSKAATLVEVLS